MGDEAGDAVIELGRWKLQSNCTELHVVSMSPHKKQHLVTDSQSTDLEEFFESDVTCWMRLTSLPAHQMYMRPQMTHNSSN